jgi:hypothetical protein
MGDAAWDAVTVSRLRELSGSIVAAFRVPSQIVGQLPPVEVAVTKLRRLGFSEQEIREEAGRRGYRRLLQLAGIERQ